MAPEEIPPGSIIDFAYLLPVGDETCRQQVAGNIARNLPDAFIRRKLTVFADGPSAKDADIWKCNEPILAVNRALNLFTDKGAWPTYWAACDPQEVVADFLPERPPQETIYYVASNCHPSVFQKLKNNQVRLWHVTGYAPDTKPRISQACSVTISASWLMHRLGFTDFEYWGWDGCFIDGKHHASNEANWDNVPVLNLNYGGKFEGNEVIGGRTFNTTRSWAAEAQAAEQFFQLADYFDIGVKINGDGMMACAQRFLKAA